MELAFGIVGGGFVSWNYHSSIIVRRLSEWPEWRALTQEANRPLTTKSYHFGGALEHARGSVGSSASK